MGRERGSHDASRRGGSTVVWERTFGRKGVVFFAWFGVGRVDGWDMLVFLGNNFLCGSVEFGARCCTYDLGFRAFDENRDMEPSWRSRAQL